MCLLDPLDEPFKASFDHEKKARVEGTDLHCRSRSYWKDIEDVDSMGVFDPDSGSTSILIYEWLTISR